MLELKILIDDDGNPHYSCKRVLPSNNDLVFKEISAVVYMLEKTKLDFLKEFKPDYEILDSNPNFSEYGTEHDFDEDDTFAS